MGVSIQLSYINSLLRTENITTDNTILIERLSY